MQRIHDETQGSPFYTRERLRQLVEEGTLVQRDGRWWTDPNLREIGLQEGIRQVIDRRLARLSENTNTLQRCAAGCSGGFALAVLQGLTGLFETTPLDCIDEASPTACGLRAPTFARPSQPAATRSVNEQFEFARSPA